MIYRNEDIFRPKVEKYCYRQLGARYHLENPGELLMVLIEIQIGTYLGEDDIVRYEDLYAQQWRLDFILILNFMDLAVPISGAY